MKSTNKPRKIGQGRFTTAYRLEDGTVKLVSCDYVKECMSLGWFPKHRLFPTIFRTDYGENGYQEYQMKYYNQPKSLKTVLCPRDYRLYRLLRKLEDTPPIGSFSYDIWINRFSTLPDEFKHEREALLGAVEACSNYGDDVAFEISPRNVGVYRQRLVLLDCFFLKSQLMEWRKKITTKKKG